MSSDLEIKGKNPDIDGSAIDVVVVGGGIAGLAAALALASRWQVALCGRDHHARSCGGETLIGAADRILCDLGFSERPGTVFAPRLGAASVWRSNQIDRWDGFLDPVGGGWRLHRSKFETHLQTLAISRGVIFGPPVSRVERDGDGLWSLAIDKESRRARFIIDATGRSAALVRMIGATRPAFFDNLVSRTICLPAGANVEDLKGFSLVEAAEQGWWHRATEPNGTVVIAFYTDADLPPARLTRDAMGFATELDRTTQVRRGVDLAHIHEKSLSTISARSQKLPCAVGEDCCAIGDAAVAIDPLSSAGLFNALYLAVRAAHGVERWLLGEREPITSYATEVEVIWKAYLLNRRAVYSQVQRFKNMPFWRRRTALDGWV